jgi:hypothetical protein
MPSLVIPKLSVTLKKWGLRGESRKSGWGFRQQWSFDIHGGAA